MIPTSCQPRGPGEACWHHPRAQEASVHHQPMGKGQRLLGQGRWRH